MARRIVALACLSGLAASSNPYKGPEAKDRMIHTNLKQEFPEGAEWIEAYCEPGLDVMTCWDTYVLLHTGDQFGQCWDIPEDKAQCAWTIGISAIGDIPGQCGASVVERARYRAEARVYAKMAGQSEHANRGCPADYEHSVSAIMMFPADEATQPIFMGGRHRRVETLVYEMVKEELPPNTMFRGYPHMNGITLLNCRSDVYPEGAPTGRRRRATRRAGTAPPPRGPAPRPRRLWCGPRRRASRMRRGSARASGTRSPRRRGASRPREGPSRGSPACVETDRYVDGADRPKFNVRAETRAPPRAEPAFKALPRASTRSRSRARRSLRPICSHARARTRKSSLRFCNDCEMRCEKDRPSRRRAASGTRAASAR